MPASAGAPASTTALRGLRVEALSAWLTALPAAPFPPYEFSLVTGGRTNLTYRVTGHGGQSVALRRPARDEESPVDVVATGDREYRVITALARHRFRVPRPVGVCVDGAVIGAPFTLVEWTDGRAVSDAAAAGHLTPAARAAVGPAFIEVLAELHALELADLGLTDWHRPTSYLQRQVRAWRTQALEALAASSLPPVRGRELATELGDLADRLTAEPVAPLRDLLLHGDYRLDNLIVSDSGAVLSVVDWELAAAGNPLADLGYALVMWEPYDSLGRSAPTSVSGFSSTAELTACYRAAVPFDVDARQLELHIAFAAWRAACIGAVVLARYEAGATAGAPVDATRADAYVSHYLRRGRAAFDAYLAGTTSGETP